MLYNKSYRYGKQNTRWHWIFQKADFDAKLRNINNKVTSDQTK